MGVVFGPVNHLGAEPGTQVYSASACHLWQAGMSTRLKLGKYTGTSRDARAHIRGLAVFAGA